MVTEQDWAAPMGAARRHSRRYNRRMAVVGQRWQRGERMGWQYYIATSGTAQRIKAGRGR